MRKQLSTVLLIAGSVALVWCAIIWTGAALFEKYEARRWSAQSTEPGRNGATAAGSVPQPAAPRASPKPGDVIAWLDVPRLGISTAVVEGDDNFELGLGAGHIPGTSLPGDPGNVGLAAHRDSFFRSLSGIEPRDHIILRTPGGTWEYTVESTRIVRPSNVSVLANSSDPELTLVTCYPFRYVGSAPLRFIVRAHRDG